MSRVGCSILAGLLALASGASTHVRAAALQSAAPRSSSQSSAQPTDEFLRRYCISCHNERLHTAGLTLEGLDSNHPASNSETWEKVVRKLRTGSMPPAGAPRPDARDVRRCRDLARDARSIARAREQPNPGGTGRSTG